MAASPARSSANSLTFDQTVPRDDDLRTVSGYDSDASEMWPDAPPGFGVYTKYSRYTGEGIERPSDPKLLNFSEIREIERKEEARERIRTRIIMGAGPDGNFTNCPPMTGKIRNQYMSRKTVEEALGDCGDDESLKKAVVAATDCEEYKAGKAVPADLLTQLSEVVGVRSQSRCRFPNCGKLSVRTDRAKEHARVHIGNHPFKCTKIQADESVGCGATFLRKHDRNRHNNGSDVLTCEDCGATIQGKGREYNLHRHKTNYCPVRKAAKQNDNPKSTATQSSGESGSSAAVKTPNGNGTAAAGAASATQVEPVLAELPMPAVMQVHGPVPASTALPMSLDANVSMEVAPPAETAVEV